MTSFPDTLTRVLAEHFGIENPDLRPETTFKDLGMDSLALVELVMVMEHETGVQLPDDVQDIAPDSTLAAVAEVVERARLAADAALPGGGSAAPASGAADTLSTAGRDG